MNKLLNRNLSKIENETLASFIFRISKGNDCSFPSTICSFLDLSTYDLQKNEFTSNSLSVLSELTDQSLSNLRMMTNSFFIDAFGEVLFEELIIKNNVQYCPLCVSVEFHHQRNWAFIPISVCLKHNVFLIDRCCNCHAKISLNSYWYESCKKCDFKYKDAVAVPIDSKSFELISQKKLYEIIIEMKAPFFKELSSLEHLKLILNSRKLITGLTSFTGEGRLENYFWDKTTLSHLYANCIWLYFNFPRNFNMAFNRVNTQLNYLVINKLKRFEYYLESISESQIQTHYANTTIKLQRNSDDFMNIDTISYEDAIHLLNFRHYQFKSLERAKIINPKFTKGNVKRYTLIEIKRLHKILEGELDVGDFNKVTFKKAISKYRQLGFSFEKAVLWITQKKLKPYRDAESLDLDGLLLDEDKLIELLDAQ
ncbi:hypothetical protein GC096_11885 [Paenibacillus sp. LMG 31461]|uniref:TniQ domain-containing protein n=1 Tax=Paenibacillus plantarum TaxID=2654975 RepID=A0ABX1X8E4_9BACL|nr:TniQ family protein [Paenibacillus plantarum]NOU64728.1 hypothetical protein [Paenibacillus plantarum]